MSRFPPRRRRRDRARSEILEGRILLATFTVTSADDAGRGTLRQAILDANASPGADTVAFNVPTPPVLVTIAPTTPLPAITETLTIDGSTQPGFRDPGPVVWIKGGAEPSGTGLVLQNAGDSVVRGLIFTGWRRTAIDVRGGTGVVIEGNDIGLNTFERSAPGNGTGIRFGCSNGRIGGTSLGQSNQVTGNDTGVRVEMTEAAGPPVTGNVIIGNSIGSNGKSNRFDGVLLGGGARGNVVGGTGPGQGNYFLDDLTGVRMELLPDAPAGAPAPTENRVEGNTFGVTITGGVGALGTGVAIVNASGNVVGGTSTGARNTVAIASEAGVLIKGPGSTGNRVEGNWIGIAPSGASSLGNAVGVIIDTAGANVIGGDAPGAGNVIAGNRAQGILVTADLTRGAATNNRVQGNRIGLNGNGVRAANGTVGVDLQPGANETLIGGETEAARNVISGNTGAGVQIRARGTRVWGNYVGTSADGNTAIKNDVGVLIVSSGGINTVGGTTPETRNVISGNGTGVKIVGGSAVGNAVQGNYIGLRADGTAALANETHGVWLSLANSNTVGGDTLSAGNVISGNRQNGVYVEQGKQNVIRFNRIGTDRTGISDVGNGQSGVFIGGVLSTGAQENRVEDNRISGNGANGVTISGGAANILRRNYIGLAANSALPNDLAGVSVSGPGATGNVIGGPGDRSAVVNIIAGNTGSGVSISGGAAGTVVQNNFIGYLTEGFGPPVRIGNGASGLTITDSNANQILDNALAYNALDGARVVSGEVNAFRRNFYAGNMRLRIDLGGTGATPNDPGDADTGPNRLQNFPIITSIASDGTETMVTGTLNSMPNTTFDIELYVDHPPVGTEHLDTVAVTTDASGNATFTKALLPVPPGQLLTATATRRVAPGGGETSEFAAPVPAPAVVDDRGPDIAAVFVWGTAWTPQFLAHVAGIGRGDATYGFAIPGGAAQLDELPWTNINRVAIRFREDVRVPPQALQVRAAVGNPTGGGQYRLSGFVYIAPTRTAVWTLADTIRTDRVLLVLDAATVTDLADHPLDGEWNNGADAYPSGDRTPGGDFTFRFNVLQGDADRSGSVLANDFSDAKRKFFSTTTNPGTGAAAYTIFHDVNGSGSILADDFSIIKGSFFDTLPPGEPSASALPLRTPATLLVRKTFAG